MVKGYRVAIRTKIGKMSKNFFFDMIKGDEIRINGIKDEKIVEISHGETKNFIHGLKVPEDVSLIIKLEKNGLKVEPKEYFVGVKRKGEREFSSFSKIDKSIFLGSGPDLEARIKLGGSLYAHPELEIYAKDLGKLVDLNKIFSKKVESKIKKPVITPEAVKRALTVVKGKKKRKKKH